MYHFIFITVDYLLELWMQFSMIRAMSRLNSLGDSKNDGKEDEEEKESPEEETHRYFSPDIVILNIFVVFGYQNCYIIYNKHKHQESD